jgi:hypothetical protein
MGGVVVGWVSEKEDVAEWSDALAVGAGDGVALYPVVATTDVVHLQCIAVDVCEGNSSICTQTKPETILSVCGQELLYLFSGTTNKISGS